MVLFIFYFIFVSYLSLAIVVALVQRVTQIKYYLDDNQKREAKRHKVAYDENILLSTKEVFTDFSESWSQF